MMQSKWCSPNGIIDNLYRTDYIESMYVNLFESTDSQFDSEIEKWNEHLQTVKPSNYHVSLKNNKKSSELIKKGTEQFQGKQFYHAIELYTKALCYAEINTENESIALANRARSFFFT